MDNIRAKLNKKLGRSGIIALVIGIYWLVFWLLPSYFFNPYGLPFRTIGSIVNTLIGLDLEGFVYYYFIVGPLFSILPYFIFRNLLPYFKYNLLFFILTIVFPYIYTFFYIQYLISSVSIGGGFGI